MMLSAAEMLARLDQTRAETEKTLQSLDPQQVIYPQSGWRIQDIVAHLTAWEEETLGSLQAHLKNKEYQIKPPISDDDYNARQFERRRNFSSQRVQQDWEEIRDWIKDIFAALTPDQLKRPILFPWGEKGSVEALMLDLIEHEAEHLRDILNVVGQKTE